MEGGMKGFCVIDLKDSGLYHHFRQCEKGLECLNLQTPQANRQDFLNLLGMM